MLILLGELGNAVGRDVVIVVGEDAIQRGLDQADADGFCSVLIFHGRLGRF
ncbi:hypothetical protein ACUXMI_002569 [Cupriavidus metallidurans]|uniref:hypothetical protein n=1 Tax=Cupriavidus metallidurans TaxID=119219 RepID=UPI000AA82305|nr:hypothetical protein [Cupriavidus metallidurans]MDE4922152.1 hypothetical protein [Cupriavidus metallidurans]QGS32791.1 hypothetical protein FOB83_28750 [Cupriavidus metallidurans]